MMILAKFRFLLDMAFHIAVVSQKPPKDSFLDLLVVFLLKEFITEELHRPYDKKLTSLVTCVESTYRAVGWETNGATRQNCLSWLANIDCAPVGVDKLEPAIFVPICQFVLGVSVLLRVLAWFVLVIATEFSLG